MPTDQLSTTFAALADPTRRAILARLSDGDATVNELAEPFPISVQAVSQHLQVLERAGLIERGRSAQLRPSRLRGALLKDDRGLARALPRVLGRRASTAWTSGCVTAEQHGFSVTRVFDAPRERVWREWTEPEAFADWFGGAGVRDPARERRDGRAAGRRLAGDDVRGPGPARDPLVGRVPRGRRRPRGSCSRSATATGRARYELVTVELADLGDGRTEMRVEQRGGMTPDELRAREGRLGRLLRPDRRAARPR